MEYFYIDWTTKTGRKFTTEYIYDGIGCQKGYSKAGWAARCAEYGMRNGFSPNWNTIRESP